MSTTRKFALGLGIAGGALLAAWFLTGDRKKMTKDFLVKKAQDLKQTLKKTEESWEDSEVHYI